MEHSCAAFVLALILGGVAGAAEKGLVAHWGFDEGKGTILHDRSGHNNHGTINGAKWVKNGDGYALEFDGKDDHVDCGAGPSLDLREKVTITAWARPATVLHTGEAGIAGKKYASYVLTQAKSSVYTYISGGPNYAKTLWKTGVWHHVAGVYDGKSVRIYLDGRLGMTRPSTRPIKPGGHFWLGRSDGTLQYTKDAHFRGKITDVRAYNRALTHKEIIEQTRTGNITNTVDVTVTPLPQVKKLAVTLDKRGLGPRHQDVTIDVAVHQQNAEGEPAGPAQLKASTGRFDKANETVLTLPAHVLQPGPYVVQATATSARGEKIGRTGTGSFEWPDMKRFPRGPAGARQLNNLVTELLNVEGPGAAGKEQAFVNPRTGWIFISNNGSAEARITGKALDKPMVIPLSDKHGDAHEAMRYLPAGPYRVTTPKAKRLIVRSIPHLIYAYYNSNPRVTEFGKFEGAFQEKHVFKNINTFCRDNDAAAAAWAARGKRWLGHVSFVRWPKEKQNSADAIYEHLLTKEPGFVKPQYAGMVANEFGSSHPKCAAWAKAVDRILSDPRFKDKGFYPYAGNLSDGPEGRQLVNVLLKHRGAVLCERYLKEQRTELDAWRYMQKRLVEPASAYRENCPGSVPHLVYVVGIFSGPPETLDTFPHVSHKTYLDMQFNTVANDPAFDGMGGIMSYESSYCDEETVRWTMRLFRHYAIEGKSTMLTHDPYILTHLRNGDFEKQGKGWSLAPATAGSIRFATSPGFGWMQGRYPRTTEGDTVLVTVRQKNRPNVFSQEIKNLEPGRLYSLRMFSGDFKDMLKKQTHAITIKLDNVTLLPEKCFTHVFQHHRAHWAPPYNGTDKKAWMNYHWRLFKAEGKTARVTICDWASEREPGGPTGQELMYNFVQVQPYFPDEPEQTAQ